MTRPSLLPSRVRRLAGIALATLCHLTCGLPPDALERSDRARLVEAVGDRRLFHGRAAGGFEFGPAPRAKRSAGKPPDVPFAVSGVAAQIRARFDARPSPMAAGNLAIAHLLMGDPGRAVGLAELRALQDPVPEAYLDLSAAFLERAIREANPDDFARSYDAALRALRTSPDCPEALFNRAQAVDGLGLAWIASQAWRDYLAVDSDGPWSQVAREGLARSTRTEAENNRAAKQRPRIHAAWAEGRVEEVKEIATARPDLAREIVRRAAIPALARAKVDGAPLAPSLAIARGLNEIAESVDRDTLDREAIAGIERGDVELAAAHISFAQASQELDERRVDKAAPGIFASTAVFKKKGSSYAELGELQSALADFFGGRRAGLISRYGDLIARNKSRYPLIRARAYWMRGLCEALLSANQWRAFLDRREALSLLTEAGQRDSARQIAGQLWQSLRALGREAEASRLLPAVTSSLSIEDVPLRTLGVIETLSEFLTDRGLPLAALDLRKRTEIVGDHVGATVRVNAALDLIELARSIDDGATVAATLSAARRALPKIEDSQIRSDMEIQLGLASLAARPYLRDPVDADVLISRLRERTNEVNLMKALTLIGEGHLADGRLDQGEVAFREALNLHLAATSRITESFERIKGFEAAERAADGLVDLLALAGRHHEALALVEQMRHPDDPPMNEVGEVTHRIAPEEAVLSYWTLPNRTLLTILTATRIDYVVLPVSRRSIRALVEGLTRSIEIENHTLVADSLGRIHAALVAPAEKFLGASRKLWIVPDREIWEVPFGGLAVRGHPPLASRFEMVFTSSIRDFMRSRPSWETPDSILAVGNPSWDRSLFPDLPSLPESEVEARSVSGLYSKKSLLRGPEATRRAVRRLAPRANVIHFATHAVGNHRDPASSFLLLSAEGADPGTWRAGDPGWEALSRAQLIVLSACNTGSQRTRFGSASLGVLRSIQQSSEAQVLVSTGDVDDAEARRLLEAFHRHLLAGGTPAAALRQAQIEAHRERSGLTWMLYRIVV